MTQWMEPPTKRLKKWRSFRQSIDKTKLVDSLQELVNWFKTAPLSSRVIDVYDNTLWPGPWDLLYAGDMDENAIALAMAYSLQLADVNCEVLLVQDNKISFLGLVVLDVLTRSILLLSTACATVANVLMATMVEITAAMRCGTMCSNQ